MQLLHLPVFLKQYSYLQQDLKIVCNYAKLYKEWKRLIQKGRTPKGIYFALKYFYDVKHGDTSKSGGSIGIVDYIYDEATSRKDNSIKRIKTMQQVKKKGYMYVAKKELRYPMLKMRLKDLLKSIIKR